MKHEPRITRIKNVKNLLIILLVLIAGVGILGPYIAPHNPLEMNLDEAFKSPSLTHLFGTDNHGRDVLSRVLCAGRVSLGIGFFAAAVSLLIGLFLGLIAGFIGGIVDKVICAIIDITLSFPSLLLAIGIAVVLPPGFISVILALTLVGWASFARFTRGIVWNIRNNCYVEAASILGAKKDRIILKHILPNCLPLVAVTGFLNLGTFILSEASLSFLGLGVPPPAPTWGGMINYGREFIQIAPWIVIFPGLALMITVIACNLLGDRLRDKFDRRAA